MSSIFLFTWSEKKRTGNLAKHGLDFAEAEQVFDGETLTIADDRFHYQEIRYLTTGLLRGCPVSILHTESAHEIRVISFRVATAREAAFLYRAIGREEEA